MAPKLDDALLDRLLHLARLDAHGADREGLRQDLERILGFMDKLSELDLTNVEPMLQVTPGQNHWREGDQPQPGTPHQDALANAPKRDSDYFRVPKVNTGGSGA